MDEESNNCGGFDENAIGVMRETREVKVTYPTNNNAVKETNAHQSDVSNNYFMARGGDHLENIMGMISDAKKLVEHNNT